MLTKQKKLVLANRFRGMLPVVIDVECSGLDPTTDALLEIAAVTLAMDSAGKLYKDKSFAYQVEPFAGARIDPEALAINKIDLTNPLRYPIPEQQALRRLFAKIKACVDELQCQRAVLVGHNAWFDLAFMMAAAKRCRIKAIPFHSFTSFDTATLAGVALGETVLARALKRAGIAFDINQAHSGIYDAERTAELFCYIVNRF